MDIQLVECTRDAIQGIHKNIPTEAKAAYLQKLLKVGFHTLDMGSFVSPKAIPQMADTGKVLDLLDLDMTNSKLLVIIANLRGAQDAVQYQKVDYLGFPFSISETFQIRNTNATREEAFERIREINELVHKHDKQLVVYFSMCFGNPYGDLWHPDIVTYWTQRFSEIGASVIALSDTVGIGQPDVIKSVVSSMRSQFPDLPFGVHLHTHPDKWHEKIAAAYQAGCTRYDSAIGGYGGCPMAQDELVGNMPTSPVVRFFTERGKVHLDLDAFEEAKAHFSSMILEYV